MTELLMTTPDQHPDGPRYKVLALIDADEHQSRWLVLRKGSDASSQLAVAWVDIPDVMSAATRLKKLVHPNVVSLLELGVLADKPCVVTRYIPGPNLLTVVRVLVQMENQELATLIGATMVVQLCKTATFAQRREGIDGRPLGLLLGQLNPAELILDKTGRVVVDRVSEWSTVGEDREKGFLGCAPELTANAPLNHQTDQYHLGALLSFLLSYLNQSAGEDDVSYWKRHLWSIAGRATSEKPTDRFPSVDRFQQAILEVINPVGGLLCPNDISRWQSAWVSEKVAIRHPAVAAIFATQQSNRADHGGLTGMFDSVVPGPDMPPIFAPGAVRASTGRG